MYCIQRKWCDLVVRAADLHIERIYYNNDFWTKALSKLKEFYFTAILPETSLPGSTAIREPTEHLKNNWLDIFNTFVIAYCVL